MENSRRKRARENYSHCYTKEVALDAMQDTMRRTFFENIDPRRRQEMSDGGIIRENDNDMANLPRQAIHHEYPRAGYYSSSLLDQDER